MSPGDDERRPVRGGGGHVGNAQHVETANVPLAPDRMGPRLARRAAAARRFPPVDGRHGDRLAAHDPALNWPPTPRAPGTYGLTPDEIRREAQRLEALLWQDWEVREVIAAPGPVAA